MGTESRGPPNRHETFTDLVRALTEHRRGVHADRMATHLLRADAAGTQLVGLLGDGGRAVLYNTASHTLEAVPFDKHGLRRGDAETLWRRLGDAASWVDANRESLAWVHPHLRWVLDIDDDAAAWRYVRYPGSSR